MSLHEDEGKEDSEEMKKKLWKRRRVSKSEERKENGRAKDW
jgi:hypothetical protein